MHTASSSHIEEVLARTSHCHSPAQAGADDVITRSWTRCVTEYGLDPTRVQPARIIESAHLREHREQIESFLRVARAGMEQLYKRVAPLGYVLLLTDTTGITVDYIGNDQWDRDLKRSGLCLGSDWNETHTGTCGVGTCIVERVPLTCHQGDHFDAAHIALTCTTAPLFDPMGEFIGVLDISALSAPSEKASQHLARHLTMMFAQKVEDANFLRHFGDKWILRLGTDWALVDVSGECMLAFDADGRIAGANSGARQMLVLPDADGCVQSLVGQHLTDVFRAAMDDIWRVARSGTTSDRTVLSTRLHEMFYAMATPPRHTQPKLSRSPERHGEATLIVPPRDCAAFDQLAGDDPPMQRLIDQAKRLVNKKLNILLHGETGTGKELLAKAWHDSSLRARKPFVAINCASIPESLIESELFGYTGGSFTGGRSKGARGLILQADGGTLFLDEIGDMPLHLQTRLLRVLSEHEIMPLGADTPLAVDLTVVAASHRDLRRLIADGLFREDLYYRLCGATLHLPPLRLRADKSFLIDRILQQEAQQVGQDAQLSDSALASLLKFDWPGNLRQLRNALRFALAVCDGGYIKATDLPQELIAAEPGDPASPAESSLASTSLSASLQVAAAKQTPVAEKLLAALRQHRWNVTAAARDLGLCRATVYRRMKRYHIVSPTDQ